MQILLAPLTLIANLVTLAALTLIANANLAALIANANLAIANANLAALTLNANQLSDLRVHFHSKPNFYSRIFTNPC